MHVMGLFVACLVIWYS